MASLYKKPVVITDPETGMRSKTKSKKWWGRYKDEHGFDKRIPLANDKTASAAMLNEIVVRVERIKAGIVHPTDVHQQRPLETHICDFESYLESKGNCTSHCVQTASYIRRLAAMGRMQRIPDLCQSKVMECIKTLREKGLGPSTGNHYLRAIKAFARWLARDGRAPNNRLEYVSLLNTEVDRRHDRRALSDGEFARLVEAARSGRDVVTISGIDRAMMYVLAAWTGFRKGELGSLTPQSFQLDGEPATVAVEACYSKRKRNDTQVLHPEVVRQLRTWLDAKRNIRPNSLLFPVSRKVPGGIERPTATMMQVDLAAARAKWIAEVSGKERKAREESDFLAYQDRQGRFADFRANRHTFISNLTRAGVGPKMAQTLARHSDINLTMRIYTHVADEDRTAAIATLPAPPPF